MNIRALSNQAERVQAEGDVIYERLLPTLKARGYKSGLLVAISIETGDFVIAETRAKLMSSYKEKFGQTAGWVRRIECGEDG